MAKNHSELVDALYRGVLDSTAFERALDLLMVEYRCPSAVLISVDAQSSANSLIIVGGTFRDATTLYETEFAALDPAPSAFARLPRGSASTTDRILGEEDFRSAFFNEFYLSQGFAETLGGNLHSDKSRSALIGLHRGADRPAFSDAEIASLEDMMPHVARALQLRRAFGNLQTRAAAIDTVLDRQAQGVVLLGGNGAIYVNRAMQAIAARRDGLSLDRAGRLIPGHGVARERLQNLMAAVARGGSGGIVAAPRSGGGAPYAILVAPAPSPAPGGWWDEDQRPRVILIVHDPASRVASPADLLREAFGLPPGAASLVASLAADGDLKAHAEREGITIHTARYHLRTALARTGARTQAELVRSAVRLLRDLGLREQEGSGE